MEESRSKATITTSDLTMATYLIASGHEATMIKKGETNRGHPIGAWEFRDGDAVAASVHTFNEGLAKVEPRKFHQTLTQTRRKLFEFLGIAS